MMEILPILTFISLLLLNVGFSYGQFLETYENSLLGLKFQHPSDWKIIYENADGLVLDLPNNQTNINDTVALTVTDGIGTNDLKQFFRSKLTLVNSSLVNFSSIKLTNTTLSGLPAMNVTYVFNDGRNLQGIYAIKDGTAYGIFYSAEPNTYPKYIADVNNIIKSFQITG